MTETLKYAVIVKQNEFEIRQYDSYLQAEVETTGSDYRSAVERGFNLLAGYIFGNNISRRNIDMTTPVIVSQAEKIAMTTPVTISGSGSFSMAFVMPCQYSLETLPLPKDERVHIKQISAHKVAALRFSGYFPQEQIEKNKQRLSRWLAEQGLETEGDFIVAGYSPPWVPGFMAKNEVMIKLKA
jgi:hypothetical protein